MKDFTVQKRAILVVLGLLVALDIGLTIYSWQLAAAPQTSEAEFKATYLRLKLLEADVDAAQRIKENMPTTRADCEKFEKSLPPENMGYSSMSEELDQIAKSAGLQIATQSIKQKELVGRGITEVEIDATVSGGYSSVARFVNEIQRSKKFYVLDGLTLSADTQNQTANGPLRVALHLRTYFREAA